MAALASSSSSDLMAQPLSSEGDEEFVGAGRMIRKVEFVRVITKALYSLGYKTSGEQLEEESGIPLYSTAERLFVQQILDGNWDEVIATLNKIGLEDESISREALFVILKQKFFKLLDGDQVMIALETLRNEIKPLCDDISRISELASCVVFPCAQDGSSRQDFLKAKTRLKLLEEMQKLHPTRMIPENRLQILVEEALIYQQEACIYHNSLDKEVSLYSHHYCGDADIPSRTLQLLKDHESEVWYVEFSHNGKYLASASDDRTAIIWEVTDGPVLLKHKLCGHQQPVTSVSWSPNDQELLTCGMDEAVRRWDVSTGKCLQVYEKIGHGLISCAWFPSGKRIVSGLSDKSISMWELDGKEVESWKGEKTLRSDLGITSDGERILSICNKKTILVFNIETKKVDFISEGQTITSFSLSRDRRFLLVNLLGQEIHLWNLEGEEAQYVARYASPKSSRFVVRSCFGGLDQAFIAGGCEDSQIYIWHRKTWQLLEVLPGHSDAVNCVSWNPADPQMFASASDDRTIRIWGI